MLLFSFPACGTQGGEGAAAGGFKLPAEDCTPLYEPNFDNIYAFTLTQSCAVSGVCHGPPEGKAGLTFQNANDSYDMLLAGYVDPGDPAASDLLFRLSDEAGALQMPPGSALGATERCAIATWIREGAVR
jgi:hypothetical protein